MTDAERIRLQIAERLRAARELAGLSQGQVARLLDMHRPTISEAEAGRRRISAEELAAFAKLYSVSTAWLTGESPEAQPHDPRVVLAARELSKLRPADLEKVIWLLAALRKSGEA